MTFLEFIRKNLIIAVIVIVGILVGLIMMDYGDSGSAFSRDYRVIVNDTRHKPQDIMNMGYRTESYLNQLNRLAAPSFENLLLQLSDQNGDGQLDEREMVFYRLQRTASLPVEPSLKAAYLLNMWGNIGILQPEENLAVNRLLVREAGKEFGIVPSKEQIDAYITAMPAFQKNGGFNAEAYKNIVGYRNGQADNAAERSFRDLISDMIIWDTLTAMVTADIEGDLTAEKKIDQAVAQSLNGWTASFPISAAPAAPAPDAEAIKAYWEKTKGNYTVAEKRAFTIINIIAGEGMNGNELSVRASEIQESLTSAATESPETVITNNIANADSSSGLIDYRIIPCEECTADTTSEILNTTIKAGSTESTLCALAFNKDLSTTGAGRFSQAYLDAEGKNAYIIRTDSITPSVPLPFEEAEPAARAALEAELHVENFYKVADELHKKISDELLSGKDMKTAFEAASAAGAVVTELKNSPITEVARLQEQGLELSEAGMRKLNLHESALRRTASGTLAPLVKSAAEAVITGITGRTCEEMPQSSNHQLRILQLKDELMQEWIRTSYTRYKVLPNQEQ